MTVPPRPHEAPSPRFERVLLLTRYDTTERYAPALCAGVGYVAEALRRRGIRYRVHDANLDPDPARLQAAMAAFSPDLIAVGMMSVYYYQVYELLRRIRRAFPHIPLLVAGPHASAFRGRVLEECDFVDYVAVLEAEETLVELCQGRPLSRIRGLIHRGPDGEARDPGDRPPQGDLDLVPFPTYEGFDLERYPYQARNIVSSRGCPHRCTFCPVRPSVGAAIRVRSATAVADELEHWHRRGVKEFYFVDDNFTVYRDRVLELCGEIARRRIRARFNLTNGVRADRVDPELLARLREAGFDEVAFGVESANDDILRLVKKGERLEQIEAAVEQACAAGLDVALFFLVGLPGETEAHVRRSFELALRYPIGVAYFYNIVPFPGTELTDTLERRGLLLKPIEQCLNETSHWNDRPAFVTPELGLQARIALLREGRALTRRLRVRRLTRRMGWLGPAARVAAHVASIPQVEQWLMTRPSCVRLYVKVKRTLWR